MEVIQSRMFFSEHACLSGIFQSQLGTGAISIALGTPPTSVAKLEVQPSRDVVSCSPTVATIKEENSQHTM